MSAPIAIEDLRSGLRQVLEDFPEVACAYVYGSRVRGRTFPWSDVDLAIVLKRAAGREDPLVAERVAARLAVQLGSPAEIDAHLADDLPLPVLGRIVTEGVLLFDRDPVRRVEFETSVRRLYFDFLPFLERDAREGLKRHG
jgi:predicted nucleotidyltransferase